MTIAADLGRKATKKQQTVDMHLTLEIHLSNCIRKHGPTSNRTKVSTHRKQKDVY